MVPLRMIARVWLTKAYAKTQERHVTGCCASQCTSHGMLAMVVLALSVLAPIVAWAATNSVYATSTPIRHPPHPQSPTIPPTTTRPPAPRAPATGKKAGPPATSPPTRTPAHPPAPRAPATGKKRPGRQPPAPPTTPAPRAPRDMERRANSEDHTNTHAFRAPGTLCIWSNYLLRRVAEAASSWAISWLIGYVVEFVELWSVRKLGECGCVFSSLLNNH